MLISDFIQSWHNYLMMVILTHITYKVKAKEHVILNNNVTVLKAVGKPVLADVNCYCKIRSVKALDGLKLLQFHVKHMRHSPTNGGISSVQWPKNETS